MINNAILHFEFSSAHFYKQKKWSAQKNKKTFGACYTQYGHGHNYKLKVKIEIPETKIKSEKQWLKKCQNEIYHIVHDLDHQHLNFVITEFKNSVPTTENITLYLKNKIQNSTISSYVISFSLFEMDNLWTQIQIKNQTPQ